MTSELRPAVAVWQEAYWTWANDPSFGSTARSVSIIEADREAVRAETVKEIVAWLRKGEKPFSDCDCAAHLLETGEWKL